MTVRAEKPAHRAIDECAAKQRGSHPFTRVENDVMAWKTARSVAETAPLADLCVLRSALGGTVSPVFRHRRRETSALQGSLQDKRGPSRGPSTFLRILRISLR